MKLLRNNGIRGIRIRYYKIVFCQIYRFENVFTNHSSKVVRVVVLKIDLVLYAFSAVVDFKFVYISVR